MTQRSARARGAGDEFVSPGDPVVGSVAGLAAAQRRVGVARLEAARSIARARQRRRVLPPLAVGSVVLAGSGVAASWVAQRVPATAASAAPVAAPLPTVTSPALEPYSATLARVGAALGQDELLVSALAAAAAAVVTDAHGLEARAASEQASAQASEQAAVRAGAQAAAEAAGVERRAAAIAEAAVAGVKLTPAGSFSGSGSGAGGASSSAANSSLTAPASTSSPAATAGASPAAAAPAATAPAATAPASAPASLAPLPAPPPLPPVPALPALPSVNIPAVSAAPPVHATTGATSAG